MKLRGVADANDLPEQVTEKLGEEITCSVLKGWAWMYNEQTIKDLCAANGTTMEELGAYYTWKATGAPVKDGAVLLPLLPHKGQIYSYTKENVAKLVKESDPLQEAVGRAAQNKQAFQVGGLDDLD